MCRIAPGMPPPDPTPPRLRLTGTQPSPRVTALPSGNAAPALAAQARPPAIDSPADPRWVFAVRAAAALTPGARGVLPPDARARLNRTAAALGLRPFDAALIIAIVQDAARTGREPLGDHTADQLAMVRPPDPRPARAGTPDLAMLLIATLAVATVVAVVAIGPWAS